MRIASEEPKCVLVADPVQESRLSTIDVLSQAGISCLEASDGLAAWNCFTVEQPDLILATLQLTGLTAFDLLNRVRDKSPIPFVLQVPSGEFSAVVAAVRNGASDVITLPCDPRELTLRIGAAISANATSWGQVGPINGYAGESSATMRVRDQIGALAGLKIPVLFRGERGSGRDHAAWCLAQLEGTDARDFVKIPPNSNRGRFQNDVSKTIYLDEVEQHSRIDQAYWAQRISEVERSISNAPARILASTASNLEALARRNEVDPKLAESLLRFVVNIAPLRERPDDIIPLSECLSYKYSRQVGRPRVMFSVSALELLQKHPWPGKRFSTSKGD